ncbi:MAG: hypothetical protein NTZ74_13245 [Chloroflexi bacterium]|nr:hypothetical protein [Chloroflexota bacterium]
MAGKSLNTDHREKKLRGSLQQKKLQRQQIFMAAVGIVLALTMILALVINL